MKLSIEALSRFSRTRTVLPGAAWGNEQRLDIGLAEPIAHLLRDELWPAGTDAKRWSATNEPWDATHDKQANAVSQRPAKRLKNLEIVWVAFVTYIS